MDHRLRVGAAEHQQRPDEAGEGAERETEDGEAPVGSARPPSAQPGDGHRRRPDQEQPEERQEVVEARPAQGDNRPTWVAFADLVDRFVDGPVDVPLPDHLGQVAPLVRGRAADPLTSVGVDDRLKGTAVVDLERATQLPLDQPVPGRVRVALIGAPGRQQDDPDRNGDPEPRQAGQPAPGRGCKQRQDEEGAGAVGEESQTTEGGEESPPAAGRCRSSSQSSEGPVEARIVPAERPLGQHVADLNGGRSLESQSPNGAGVPWWPWR